MLKLDRIEEVNGDHHNSNGGDNNGDNGINSQDWKEIERGVYTLRSDTPAEDSVEWGRDVSYLDQEFKQWQARAVGAAVGEHRNGDRISNGHQGGEAE